METEIKQYYRHERPEMLDFLPESLGTVMEIGCGSGVFASKVLQKYHNVEYWAIEPLVKAAKLAQPVVSKIFIEKMEDVAERIPDSYFDCVIMNDVLEHIPDTRQTLLFVKRILKIHGHFVLSIPNVRYIEHLAALLFKADWKYQSEGILDETHLRFFTKKSILRTLEEHGFEVEKIRGLNPTSHRMYGRIIGLLGKRNEDMRYLQFAISAKSS